MKKLKLNENMGEIVKAHGYELDAEERYVINIERELSGAISNHDSNTKRWATSVKRLPSMVNT